jgi:hypothetical protein
MAISILTGEAAAVHGSSDEVVPELERSVFGETIGETEADLEAKLRRGWLHRSLLRGITRGPRRIRSLALSREAVKRAVLTGEESAPGLLLAFGFCSA